MIVIQPLANEPRDPRIKHIIQFDPWPLTGDGVPLSVDVGYIDAMGQLQWRGYSYCLTTDHNCLVTLDDGKLAVGPMRHVHEYARRIGQSLGEVE